MAGPESPEDMEGTVALGLELYKLYWAVCGSLLTHSQRGLRTALYQFQECILDVILDMYWLS